MDFAELFTRSARDSVPIVWRRGLQFLFDYRGPRISVDADVSTLLRSLSRLTQAAVDLLDEGSLFVTAQVDWNDAGFADVAITVAGTGRRAANERLDAALANLGLVKQTPTADAPAGSRVARGVCALTGAAISFAADHGEGVLFAVDLTLPASLAAAQPEPNAEGAVAWLVSTVGDSTHSLAQRLQRLGWDTASLSPPEALARLQQRPPAAPPDLVVMVANPPLVDEARRLRSLLAPDIPLIVAVALGGPSIDAVECRPWPFSPAELDELTRRAADVRRLIDGDITRPASIGGHGPRALVVDDNEVNLLVAGGLLQVAGFEVETAASGDEAIARCRARAPQLVLMDVHMPGMDGLQATRQLRQLQRQGTLAHFVVMAATADSQESIQAACHAAGMDSVLSKPLRMQAIEREIDRLLPGLRRRLSSVR